MLDWIADIRDNEAHPARGALDNLLRRLAEDLQSDDEVIARAEALKERLLTHPQVAATVVSLWGSVRSALTSAMDDPDSYFYARGDELLQHLGRHLREDETWRVRVEERLGEAVAFAVNTYGHELAEVISLTVDRWDGREAAERIELHVGRRPAIHQDQWHHRRRPRGCRYSCPKSTCRVIRVCSASVRE